MLTRAFRLLSLLPTRPGEFWDRVGAIVDVKLDRFRRAPTYEPSAFDAVIAELGRRIGSDGSAVLREPQLQELERNLNTQITELAPRAPYPLVGCGDVSLGRFCYFIVRALRPAISVETGVLYGITSSFILQALHVNGSGALHSVDLPPLRREQEQFVGCVIPKALRDRWVLHRGSTRRILPRLLSSLPPVDLFVHDSLHTYRNMKREFQTVAPHLAPRSVVVSDDVHENAAFGEWTLRSAASFSATVREINKPGSFGVSFHVESRGDAVD